MRSLIERAHALFRSAHGRRLIKFASVSVISTVCTQLVLFLTYDVISLGSAIECNVIATAVSTVPAYWLNRTWTWGKRGKSDLWREVVPFWVISFIGLVLSTVAVGLAAHNADAVSSSGFVRHVFVHMANIFAYALIWVGRYLIFNKYLFAHPAAEPVGEVEAIALEEHGAVMPEAPSAAFAEASPNGPPSGAGPETVSATVCLPVEPRLG